MEKKEGFPTHTLNQKRISVKRQSLWSKSHRMAVPAMCKRSIINHVRSKSEFSRLYEGHGELTWTAWMLTVRSADIYVCAILTYGSGGNAMGVFFLVFFLFFFKI